MKTGEIKIQSYHYFVQTQKNYQQKLNILEYIIII